MKFISKYFPFLVIILSVFIFFYPFFIKGNLPIPSDTIIGLYHPFRDLYSENYPNGIPYKNALVTDPVRQQYPWKNLVVNLEKNFKLPLWNPYEMSGTPLLANFQSSVFYPLGLILLISPFSISWSVFIVIQPLLAGLFLYFYLRSLKLDKWASLLGALTWMFSGFFIAWLEWGVILHTLLWLPLIMLAKDKLLAKWSIAWIIILLFAEISSFFAGHLQVLFYTYLFVDIYLFARIYAKIKGKDKVFLNFFKKLLPFLLTGLVIVLVTSLQWIPTIRFILLSNRALDQSYNQPGWFIPWENLIQFIAPDFFGNPATLNYFGVWNYAEFVGYVGIVSLLFSFYAILLRRDKKTYFFAGALIASLVFALPNFISVLPFYLKLPLISTAQPTRLLAISCFALSVLAALGLDYFLKKRSKIWIPILIIGLLIFTLWLVTLFFVQIFASGQNVAVARSNLKLPSLLFLVSSLVLLAFSYIKKKRFDKLFLSGIILLVLFDLIRFGWKFTPFTNPQYLFPSTSAIEFLQNQKGVFRIAAADNRILPPNFSVVYRLQSIEGYDPLYLRNYAEFIAANERGDHSILPPFGFNRIITPRNLNSQAIDFLSVKYILSLNDLDNPKLKKVFEQGQTKIYENVNAFPRVFFVNKVIADLDRNKLAKDVFSNDLLRTAFVEENIEGNFIIGDANIANYSEDTVVIKTDNSGRGFLVFSDVYYPYFSATIDGKETKIYEVNMAFRGIVVPAGKHEVVFAAKLF